MLYSHLLEIFFWASSIKVGLPSHFYASKHLLRVLICVPSTSQGLPDRKASESLPPPFILQSSALSIGQILYFKKDIKFEMIINVSVILTIYDSICMFFCTTISNTFWDYIYVYIICVYTFVCVSLELCVVLKLYTHLFTWLYFWSECFYLFLWNVK